MLRGRERTSHTCGSKPGLGGEKKKQSEMKKTSQASVPRESGGNKKNKKQGQNEKKKDPVRGLGLQGGAVGKDEGGENSNLIHETSSQWVHIAKVSERVGGKKEVL